LEPPKLSLLDYTCSQQPTQSALLSITRPTQSSMGALDLPNQDSGRGRSNSHFNQENEFGVSTAPVGTRKLNHESQLAKYPSDPCELNPMDISSTTAHDYEEPTQSKPQSCESTREAIQAQTLADEIIAHPIEDRVDSMSTQASDRRQHHRRDGAQLEQESSKDPRLTSVRPRYRYRVFQW
jgi:hypothetical protein